LIHGTKDRDTMSGNLAIGIDLGGTNLKGAVMERDGTFRHLTKILTEADKGGRVVLNNILTLIDTLIQKEGSAEDIRGVGLGTPGFIGEDGVIIGGAENLPGWKGTNVAHPIKERFGLALTGGNDVTVTALAEFLYGAGRGVNNIVCFALGTGIGGGIVVNGKLYKGTHGMAGELGHIIVETGGLQCTCGLSGCVEQYASATGIVANAKSICSQVSTAEQTPFVGYVRQHSDTLSSKEVYRFVNSGDSTAVRVHEFICERLARAVGAVLNTFAPDRVILGGGVMKAGQIIIDTVASFVPRYCWEAIWERCEIYAAEKGEDAGVCGAAAMVFEEME
jgi:glucokinase